MNPLDILAWTVLAVVGFGSAWVGVCLILDDPEAAAPILFLLILAAVWWAINRVLMP